MSRLLRSLEEEGLIETVPNPQDARRRITRLTSTGQSEFQAYEALSNAQAEAFLSRHRRPDELLRAIDMVACSLRRDHILLEEKDPRHDDARYCLEEYYSELARRFEKGFQRLAFPRS